MLRNIPKVEKTMEKGYASFLGKGFDTVVETFNVVMPDELIDRLEQAKGEAKARDVRGAAVVSLDLGGETLQVASHGGRGGCAFVLTSPDFSIDIRSPKTEWNVTVRYSAAGLWQYGTDELRRRVQHMLTSECYPKAQDGAAWVKLSSVHYAFDFYSEQFTNEMRPELIGRVVCHSSSKKHANFSMKGSAWGRADYLETLTIGSKKTVELQVYDKGKEITEISGKTWMLKIWEQEGYHPPEDKKLKDVWRLEIRFGKEFLKNRSIETFEDFCRDAEKLLCEALYTKRLAVASGDTNVRRRPAHPLWSRAIDAAGDAVKMLPIGRQLTQTGEAMREILTGQGAGIVRALAVLEIGDCDDKDMEVFARRVCEHGQRDKQGAMKADILRERYKHMNVARG